MPYVNPTECRNLPFYPLEPSKFGVFGTRNALEETGFRRCATVQAGRWFFQPAYELTRVIVNTATKTVFSRTGLPLPDTESALYKPQLEELCSKFPKSWLDGYIRILKDGDPDASFGQGSFLIQDLISPEIPLWDRRRLLSSKIQELGICRLLPHRSVYLTPMFPEHVAINLWAATMELHEAWLSSRKISLYSGIVGKQVGSEYGFLPFGERTRAWIYYPFTPVEVSSAT